MIDTSKWRIYYNKPLKKGGRVFVDYGETPVFGRCTKVVVHRSTTPNAPVYFDVEFTIGFSGRDDEYYGGAMEDIPNHLDNVKQTMCEKDAK